MAKLPDYYKILSLPPDANTEQIKKAYKEKALQYHPDINHTEKAVETFQLINQAYQTLLDPEKRRKYDFTIKYHQEPNPLKNDIRYRHPADANYYYRRQHPHQHTQPQKTPKSIRRLNHFIFYSITSILVVGIIYGTIDLFNNFRITGLLFSIVSLLLILSGVRIIKKERSGRTKK